MPLLTAAESISVLRRLAPLQQFRGRVPGARDAVRWLELRPKFNGIELWVFDVDDVGTADHVDIAAFPPTSGSPPAFPVSMVGAAAAAFDYAQSQFGALAGAWREPGQAGRLCRVRARAAAVDLDAGDGVSGTSPCPFRLQQRPSYAAGQGQRWHDAALSADGRRDARIRPLQPRLCADTPHSDQPVNQDFWRESTRCRRHRHVHPPGPGQ